MSGSGRPVDRAKSTRLCPNHQSVHKFRSSKRIPVMRALNDASSLSSLAIFRVRLRALVSPSSFNCSTSIILAVPPRRCISRMSCCRNACSRRSRYAFSIDPRRIDGADRSVALDGCPPFKSRCLIVSIFLTRFYLFKWSYGWVVVLTSGDWLSAFF